MNTETKDVVQSRPKNRKNTPKSKIVFPRWKQIYGCHQNPKQVYWNRSCLSGQNFI